MNAIRRWLRWVATGESERPDQEEVNAQDIAELKARMTLAEDALRARGWVMLAPAQEEELSQ